MREKITYLLLFMLLIALAYSQCPALCTGCSPGSSTCPSCYTGFQANATAVMSTTGKCSCPDGFYLNTTNQICIFCPITCETCTSFSVCTTCMPGYEIDQNKQCTKRYSNPGQWLTMDVALDLTYQKLSKQLFQGFYISDYVSSNTITNLVGSCQNLSSQLFLGMFAFDYNTQIVKSYFGLARHDWVQIKFQFIALDRWTMTSMILEINDRESYKLTDLEGVFYSTSKTYTSSQRTRDFCASGDPDNLGFISVYLPHKVSMLKVRIRTDLSNLTSTNGLTYPSYVYFGLSNMFVRVGTCPTNCKRCSGPLKCIECLSPYVNAGLGECTCDTDIAQVTETGRCVLLCQPGYLFTKIETMTESKCILCSTLSDKMRNCFGCSKVLGQYQCDICLEGYTLNATGFCVESCPVGTYVQVAYDSTYGLNKMQCINCGTNCVSCKFGICTLCSNTTVYSQGNCISACVDGFYLSSGQCVKCRQNCAKCTSDTVCTQCADTTNFVISQGTCVPKCTLSSNCSTTCHASCSSCFGSSQTQCTTCTSATQLLQANDCVVSCTSGYFALDKICRSCTYPCSQCRNYLSCTSCVTGYVLFEQTCLRECPLNYFTDSSRTCKKCSENCRTCYNDTSCLTCANNFILFQGQCVVEKPCSLRQGYYYDQKTLQCLVCPNNCLNCYRDLCLRCNTGTVLDNGKCLTQCSDQKVEQQQTFLNPITSTNITIRVCKWKDPLCNHYTLTNGSSVCDECIFMNPMLALVTTATSSSCSFTCPLGLVKVQTNNVVTCEDCPTNCNECLSNMTCVRCSSSYVLNPVAGGAACIATCPNGYTSDGYQCLACKANCKVCDVIGRCLTCNDGFTLHQSNNCLTDIICPANQYKNINNQCTQCSSPCLTCTSASVCTSCPKQSSVQYYLTGTICLQDCPAGSYKSDLGFICVKCPTQCFTCVSSTQCTKCLTSFYLLLHPIQPLANTQIGTCVRECPLGYYNYNPLYTEKEIAYCAFCSSNCLSCYGPSQDQCLACYGSFKLVNSRCVERCPLGKYEDTTGHCDWCHPSCLECTGPAEFQCVACAAGYYLYRSQCYPYSCPGSTYPVDYDNRVCQLCQWGCQVCTSPYNCSVCTGGFYLYDGWCYTQCPANTQPYLDTVIQGMRCGNCTRKWGQCVQCNATQCLRCDTRYFLFNITSITPCIGNCPTGYYAQVTPFGRCVACPTNCQVCTSASWCSQCSSGYILSPEGTCTTTCPQYKFYSRSYSSCKSCSDFCINCLSQTRCQTCTNNSFLFLDYSQSTLTTYCLKECGENRFEDLFTGICQNCSINCRTCTSFSSCTKCYSGFNLTNGYCYPNNVPNPTCSIANCAKCLSATICESCQIPFYLSIVTTAGQVSTQCVTSCPSGTYEAQRSCLNCNTTCVKCQDGPNDCSQCIDGLVLYNKRCWRECPKGFYKNNGNCVKCTYECYDCLSANQCKVCRQGYFAYKGGCYEQCPDGTYGESNYCLDCMNTCKQCQSLTSCTSCITGYLLFQGQCRLHCPDNYYLKLSDQQMTCKKCPYPCANCKSEEKCTGCVQGFVLSSDGTKCLTQCQPKYYPKPMLPTGYQCSQCQTGCSICLNATYCLQCQPKLTLSKGNCLTTCPLGSYTQNTTQSCRSCSSNCLLCTAFQSCTQCHNQTVLYNGKCVELCPAGTYKTYTYVYQYRSITAVCLQCKQPCKQCTGAGVYSCKSCLAGFYLYDGVCVGSCPKGYFVQEDKVFAQIDSSVNLVKNGNFKDNKCYADWCLYTAANYANEVQGWIPDDELEIGYGRIYSNFMASQRVLELAPNKNTCVKQNIPNLSVGVLYQLTFSWAARKDRSFTDCQLKIFFGGDEIGIYPATDYQVKTLSIDLGTSVASSVTELKFCSFGGQDNSYGAIIKDVSLVVKTQKMVDFDTSLVDLTQLRCQKCPYGCASCISASECTQCLPSWTLTLTNLCKPPTPCTLLNCQVCQVVSGVNVCRKCINPYSLAKNTLLTPGSFSSNTNATCVLQCPSGTFRTDGFQCKQCSTNCVVCSSTECVVCKSGTFVYKGFCISQCLNGYVAVNGVCKPSPCLYKNSNNMCEMCMTPYLLQQGVCVTACAEKTYQSDLNCLPCDSITNHCANCTSLTTCTSCVSGYFLYLSKCIANCPPSTYQSSISTNTTCLPCQLQGCLTCTSATTCTLCKAPYFLTLGKCQLTCPIGSFKSSYDQICIACQGSCLQCLNETTCTQCNNQTILFNSKCINQCPVNYFLDSGSCKLCDPKCFTCLSATNCTTCKSGYFLSMVNVSNVISYTCSDTCQPGYYPTMNSTCAVCSAECQTCDFEKCLSCPAGKYLLNGKCLLLCPQHYFAFNGKCLPCSPLCKTCQNSSSTCLTCYPGFNFISQSKTCAANCSISTQFYDSLTYQCQNCSKDCETCYGQRYDQCLTCNDPLALSNGVCVVKCPANSWRDANSVCKLCDLEKCLTCQGAESNCTSCAYPKVLVVYDSGTKGKCEVNCGAGYYYDANAAVCKACPGGCASCVNASMCLTCESGKFLYEAKCLTTCPLGYVAVSTLVDRTCVKCPSNCLTCIYDSTSTFISCTSCVTPFLLYNSTCHSTCPLATYPDTSACTPCPQKCLTCTSATTCLTCQFPFIFHQNQCLTTCPNNYQNVNYICQPVKTCTQLTYKGECYATCPSGTFLSGNTCLDCPVTCQECFNAGICTQCKVGFYMYVNEQEAVQCVAQCPLKTYLNNLYCVTCPAPCSTCQLVDNVVNCVSCLSGFSLNGKCLSTCPAGFYVVNGACVKCNAKCLTCDSSGVCITCANSAYTATSCQSSPTVCPVGQYVSQLTTPASCANCNDACLTCYGPSAGECTACKNVTNPTAITYYLYQSSCMPDCPQGYNKNPTLNKCTLCLVANCKSCPNSPTTCSQCVPNYFLFTNSSVTKCIQSCTQLTTLTQTFVSLSTNTCTSCDSQVINCLECYFSSLYSRVMCQTCQSTYYLLQNNTCTNLCIGGFYVSQNKYCLKCSDGCNVCNSDSVCVECVNGYGLYQAKCYATCPTGYYNNNGVCTACQTNCKTCDSSKCLSCVSPFLIDSNNHCTNCLAGFFYTAATSTCSPCSYPCLQCTTSATTCTSCPQPLLLLYTNCYDKCPTGFYPSPNTNICLMCEGLVTNCAECVSGGCLKCKDNFYLSKANGATSYSCVSSCPAGYYADTSNKICLKCTAANCLECTSPTQCTKCTATYYSFNGACLLSCPTGYAPVNTAGVLSCTPCKQGCKQCPVAITSCTVCEQNLQDDGTGKCTLIPNSCLTTQYVNALGTCSPCHDTCKTCYGGLRTNCLTCNTPTYQLQSDGSCKQVITCLTSQFYDPTTTQCQPCTSKYGPSCVSCDESSCFSCSSGVLTTDAQSCTTTCPPSTYIYNGACVPCPSLCKTCTSSTSCSQCLLPTHLLYNSMCYTTCPIMTQAYSGTCRACDDRCLACVNTQTNCTSCKSLYKFYQNSCLDTCPQGTFQANVAGVNNIVCQQCTSPCATCSVVSTNCTSCALPYALYNNQCVNSCPSTTFHNTTSNICILCQYPCLTCANTATYCLSCASGYVYDSASHICSNQCGDGAYLYTNPSTSATSCVPCSLPHCKTCDATKCYKCTSPYFATVSPTTHLITSCTLTCPDYFFPSLSNSTCQKCIDLCLTCTSASDCQKCVTPYFLYNNSCITSCPQKTYEILNIGGFKCQDCGALCSTCVDNLTCTICDDQTYLLQGECYSQCPQGYYERASDKTCRHCLLQHCGNCTATSCITCGTGYFGMADATGKITVCLDNCGVGYFANTQTRQCQRCILNCKTCINNSTCVECLEGKSLFIQSNSYTCLDECPVTYFSDNSSGLATCRPCQQNCLHCYNTQRCFECQQNFTVFYNTSTQVTCITSCPTHYYLTNTTQGYLYCQACSSHCVQCVSSHQCKVCQETHTLVNFKCVPHNCVNCDLCDQTVQPAICKNCTTPYSLYKVKCFDLCPVYYYSTANESNLVVYCQKCMENCITCSKNDTCDECIPDYVFIKGQGCLNEAVHNYGPAANMSGFTSNITQTMAKIYMGTSVGPVAFGEMTTTYFNLEFTQFMQFHPTGGNPEMTEFLNSLQTMSLTSGGTTVNNGTLPQQVQARRRMLATSSSTYFTESFIEVNASIFILMFAFLGAYLSIWIFQKFVTEACRVSCNSVWFYLDAICQFMQKRFKWIYFDFIMWLSYVPFLYFSILQLKGFSFANGSQGFSTILAIIIIITYPLYPIFICYLLKSHYTQISIQSQQQEIKQTLTQMSLSPYLYKVKRPIKNIVLPFEQQDFSFRKYFTKINFILIYYPLKYLRKFAFILVAALVPDPVTMVAILIAINVAFIIYMIALRPRVMPYIVFDLIIEFVLLAFEVFLLVYLAMDGSKIAMMSIVTHAVGFITANLSLITAIVLNLIAYYKIFLCIKDLIFHLREKAAERLEAENKFEVEKKFLDPNSDLYIDKQIGKLKRLGDNDDTDEDDDDLRLSAEGRKLLQNLGQKDLLLNGIDPIKYVKDISRKENFGIEQKQLALKYVNQDDKTDSDDSDIDENAMNLAKNLKMDEKTLALNKIHPVKYAKELTKDDAPLQKQYKKFDQKHIDSRLAKKINDDNMTDSDDDQIDETVMNIAKNLNLNEKQLAFNDLNPMKFLRQDTKKDAPLQDRYKKFDQKNVDRKVARMINQDNMTQGSDDSVDEEMHDLAKKLQLNEKQLAFNQINPVKFFKEETKIDAPLEEQYQKFDEKNVDKHLARKINEDNNTDSSDDSQVDEVAHNLARKLNLNEKQLAFNEINPMKFFKEQTKLDAPLEEVYEKFDEKNVDVKLARVINDDGDTDSQDQSQEEKQGYRLARQLKLNEKQLAANNLNPVKVMAEQAKKDDKLKNIMRQFDQKDIDMKVARMINDNGQTSSQDQDQEQVDKIIVARQLKLDQKQLAANNINPVKYAKQTTKIDPVTNQPKINHAVLSTAVESTASKPKKLLDKELQMRNEMKRQLSENSGTDEDEEDIKLSKFTKEKLKNMTEKEMMMAGLDPIKAVKKITKEAIAKKMANMGNRKVYDDEIPDFKVSSNKQTQNPIKSVIKSTQQKLKQSTKNMLGSKKDPLRGSKKIPSEQSHDHKNASKLIDSQSDQQNQKLTNKQATGNRILNSYHPTSKNQQKLMGRRQVQNDWDDQFQVMDKHEEKQKSRNQQNIIVTDNRKKQSPQKKSKVPLVDPNNKIKNFDQEFDESFIHSEQSSEAQLNLIKKTHEEDLEDIQLHQDKSSKNIDSNIGSKKIINLDLVPSNQRIQTKKPSSALDMKPQKNLRQDEMFDEFEEFEDLGQVQQKKFEDKKYQRKHTQSKGDAIKSQQQRRNLIRQFAAQGQEFQDEQISDVQQKQIQENKLNKYTRQRKAQEIFTNSHVPNQITESLEFNQKQGKNSNVPSSRSIPDQRYSDIVKNNRMNLKLPQNFESANLDFEQNEYAQRPSKKMIRSKSKSKVASDHESDDGEFSQSIRKDRVSAKQRLRSKHKAQDENLDSKRSSQVVRKDKESKNKIQKLKIGNVSQNQDEIQKIDI